jgi:hypothetical protein
MMSFIISVGPDVQRSVFSTISNDAPDLYSSAYQDSINRFPNLSIWLLHSANWVFPVVGALIILLSFRTTKLKQMVVAVGLWTAVLLTLTDLAATLGSAKFELTDQITNVTANLVGGGVIAVLFGGAMVGFRLLIAQLGEISRGSGIATAAIFLVAYGAVASCAAYFGLREVYEPLPAKFSVTILTPTAGFYLADPKPPPPFKGIVRRGHLFSFLPTGKAPWTAMVDSSRGAFLADWRRAQQARSYDVSMRLVGDCFPQDLNQIPAGPPLIFQRDVRSLSVALDAGAARAEVARDTVLSGIFTHESPTYFWLTQDQKDHTFKIDQFAQTKDRIILSSWDGLKFLIGMPLIGKKGENFQTVTRTLNITLDGVVWPIKLQPTPSWSSKAKLKCRAIKLNAPFGSSIDNAIPSDLLYGSLLVSLTPSSIQNVLYERPESTLTFSNMLGSVSANNVTADTMERSDDGDLGALSVQRGLSELEVDGAKIETRPNDSLTVIGDLVAKYGKDGQILANGEARAIWRDNTRLSSTRWEKLTTEWRIALVSAVIAAISGAAAWLYPQFRRHADDNICLWLDDDWSQSS